MYTVTVNENVEKNHRPIRIAVVCAAVMMAVALVPLFADGLIAEETVEEGNDGDVHWVISGDTMTITPKEGKDKADMDDYDDAGEEPNWRKAVGWPNVKNVEIKGGVTCVGKRAFAYVDDEGGAKIETVTFDGSVKIIKERVLRLKSQNRTLAVVQRLVRAIAIFKVDAIGMVVEGDLHERLLVIVVHENQPVAASRVIRHQFADELRARLGLLDVLCFNLH